MQSWHMKNKQYTLYKVQFVFRSQKGINWDVSLIFFDSFTLPASTKNSTSYMQIVAKGKLLLYVF